MSRLLPVLVLICGTYSTTALVQQYEGYPRLLINPGTQSEMKLVLKFADTPKLSAFINQTVSAEVELNANQIEKISKIARVLTSELSQTRGTFLKCKN